MKTEVSQNYRKYYLSEFSLYDGDHFITFNIVDINTDKNEITVAISNEGKISVCTFDLKSDGKRLYFEYGVMCEKIAVDGFEHIKGD
jgi:major membrane immunogen (membrane-anchored lipoprotein)